CQACGFSPLRLARLASASFAGRETRSKRRNPIRAGRKHTRGFVSDSLARSLARAACASRRSQAQRASQIGTDRPRHISGPAAERACRVRAHPFRGRPGGGGGGGGGPLPKLNSSRRAGRGGVAFVVSTRVIEFAGRDSRGGPLDSPGQQVASPNGTSKANKPAGRDQVPAAAAAAIESCARAMLFRALRPNLSPARTVNLRGAGPSVNLATTSTWAAARALDKHTHTRAPRPDGRFPPEPGRPMRRFSLLLLCGPPDSSRLEPSRAEPSRAEPRRAQFK
ncbi:Hypothetical predicted protein, partial [Olea europaea subsp. europaea]